jgi:hypothetical protein
MERFRVRGRKMRLIKKKRNRRVLVGRASRSKGSPKVLLKIKKNQKSKFLKRTNRFRLETINPKGKEIIKVTRLFLRGFGV